MNNAKSFPSSPITFAIGAIVGLAVGLLIGWVLWPVEWQGATLRDLDTAGKAEYIAAVADAFVIYDSPEAAAIAQQRLAALQTDLDSEFVGAIRYFQSSEQAERAIRISNIGRLANSLGMVPPDLAGVSPTIQTELSGSNEQAAGDTTAANADGSVATTGSSSDAAAATATISWFRWLLWLLAALLLLGGGLYLLGAAGIFDWQRWLATRLTPTGQRTDGDDDDEFEQPTHEYASRPGERRNTFVSESEDLAFENEEEEVGRWRYQPGGAEHTNWKEDGEEEFDPDEEFGDEFSQNSNDDYTRFRAKADNTNPAHFTIDSFERDQLDEHLPASNFEPIAYANEDHDSNETSDTSGRHKFDDSADADADELESGIVPTIDSVMATVRNRPSATAGFGATDEERRANHWEDADLDEEDDDNDFDDAMLDQAEEAGEEQAAVTSFTKEDADAIRARIKQATLSPMMPSTPRPEISTPSSSATTQSKQPTQQSPVPQRPSRHKLIDQHTLHYQMGISEYDESKPIVDPSSGKYIGEFGMGTSSKNGVIQPNGEHIAALEVWLFDKSDEKNMGNQTRILLSEYAVDHNLEQAFVKERQDNPRPFTPQPGVHFQLESQNLLLDCTIIDVQYLNGGGTKGMFQSIKVDMSVHQKP